MNAISTAIRSGYSVDKILDYLKKIDPDLAIKINASLQAGHSVDKVLNYIAQNGKKVSKFLQSEEKPKNIYQQATRGVHPATKQFGSAVLGAGLGALGSVALSRAIPQAVQQIAPNILESKSINVPPTPPPKPKGIAPQQPNAQPAPIENVQPPNLTANILPIDAIKKLPGLEKKIQELRSSGNDADRIVGYIRGLDPKTASKLEKESGQPLEKLIDSYLTQNPINAKETPIETQKQESVEPKSKELDVQPEVERKQVALPTGQIGEIESIKNGIAKINVDGEIKTRKMDDLIESPLPQKDLAELYQDLLSGIEKESGEQVSRNVYWAGYDPKTNELAFVPHHGGLYIYDNISPEDATQLTSILNQRKSTGENYIGAWEKGTKSPIGAGMYQLIQKLQKERGGKGKEYSGKFEKIYDALELAKEQAKKKHAKKTKKPRPR